MKTAPPVLAVSPTELRELNWRRVGFDLGGIVWLADELDDLILRAEAAPAIGCGR